MQEHPEFLRTIVTIQPEGAEVRIGFADGHSMKWMPAPGMGNAKVYAAHLRTTILGTQMECPTCDAEAFIAERYES